MCSNILELFDGIFVCDDWFDNDGIVDEFFKIVFDLMI